MCNIKIGNIWWYEGSPNSITFITTNRIINKNKLVMGAGIALQAKKKYPDLPKRFASFINERYKDKKFYGIILPKEYYSTTGVITRIGAIQTKVNYAKKSKPALVEKSLRKFSGYCSTITPDTTINCIMPGIGLGGLSLHNVLYMISNLTFNNNVNFWLDPKYLKNNI